MQREDRITSLMAALDTRILLLDGAMGTMIQSHRLGEDDYRGERFADWDLENVEMVLDEALKIAQEQMGPCNEDGDRIGAQYADGRPVSGG